MSYDPNDRFDTYNYHRDKDDFYRNLDTQRDNFIDDLKYDREQAEWRATQAREYIEKGDLVGGLHYLGYQGDLSSIRTPGIEAEASPPPPDPYQKLNEKMEQAIRMFRQRDDENAENALSAIIQRWPEFGPAYSYRGMIRYSKKAYKEAISDFSKVIGFKRHTNPSWFRMRGNCYFWLGNNDKALADYSEFIALGEDDPRARLNRASCYLSRREWVAALEDCNVAISMKPNDARACCLRGDAKRELRDWEGARRDLDRALQLEPDYYLAYLSRGSLFHDIGDDRAAIDDFKLCLRYKKDWGHPYLRIGDIHLRNNDYKAAIKSYQNAEALYAAQGDERMVQIANKAVSAVLAR